MWYGNGSPLWDDRAALCLFFVASLGIESVKKKPCFGWSNVVITYSATYHHLSSFIIIYHHWSLFIIIYHHLSSFIIISPWNLPDIGASEGYKQGCTHNGFLISECVRDPIKSAQVGPEQYVSWLRTSLTVRFMVDMIYLGYKHDCVGVVFPGFWLVVNRRHQRFNCHDISFLYILPKSYHSSIIHLSFIYHSSIIHLSFIYHLSSFTKSITLNDNFCSHQHHRTDLSEKKIPQGLISPRTCWHSHDIPIVSQ